jgi:hypothetical protein
MGLEDLRGTWRERVPCLTATKQPKAVLANALFALREAEEWQGVLAYDEFALTVVTKLPPPWCCGNNDWKPDTPWTDRDDALATDWVTARRRERPNRCYRNRSRDGGAGRNVPPRPRLPLRPALGRHQTS